MTPENTGQAKTNIKTDIVSGETSSLRTSQEKKNQDSSNDISDHKKLNTTSCSTDNTVEVASTQTSIKKDKSLVTFIEKEVNVPDIGTDEVEVTEILVQVGDKVDIEQSLITVEGDKASIEIPAPFSGTVKEIKISAKDKVSTGSLIMIFEVEEVSSVIPPLAVGAVPSHHGTQSALTQSTESAAIPVVQVEEFNFTQNDTYIYATPLIRRLARKLEIDLTKVHGSGRKGRILREDIQSYVKNAIKHDEKTFSTREKIKEDTKRISSVSLHPEIDFSQFGEIKTIPLSRIQKLSGANLKHNWITIPHVTHFDKGDITDLEDFRKQQNNKTKNNTQLNVKFTLMPFIIKAASVALKKMPRFSSSLSEDGQNLILKTYINIGIAVDTLNGLVVPVLKNVDKKNVTELSHELSFISQKARDGKLTTGEMKGGCFTISNIGSLGTTYFAPIVNAPEVAILGVSQSRIEPVWNGKEFIPRLMMPISLSFDHRVIDGADGARFLSIIKDILSDIRQLVM